MSSELEYWKRRCELAEKALETDDAKDWYTWESFKDNIEPEKLFITGGLADHPIISSRLHEQDEVGETEIKSDVGLKHIKLGMIQTREKLINVRKSFYDFFPVPLKMEYCDAVNNHLKALDEIIEQMKDGAETVIESKEEPFKINAKTWKEFIAGALKFACETGRITGDHDFNADVAGTKDSFEQIASDYLKSKEE